MTFEVDRVQVMQPLEPYQDPIFTDPIDYVEEPNFLD